MTENRKRAVLYLRVSTQEQATEGYSLAAQEQNGREFSERMGYELVKVYADEGFSGKSTEKRKGYQQMIVDAEQKKFDIVIILETHTISQKHDGCHEYGRNTPCQ